MDSTFLRRLELSLFSLRTGVFLVMLMWTIDKFVRVDHAKEVFEKFYFLSGFEDQIIYMLAFLECVLIFAFLIGLKKRISYGLILVLHSISTFSAFNQYLNPFEGVSLLFFAAWPMLAACWTLYLLRDYDRMLSIK